MTSRDFCYWLQGLFELGSPVALDAKQTDLVKVHLAMVFVHEINPSAGDAKQQAVLNDIHKQLDQTAKAQAQAGQQISTIGGIDLNGTVYRC